MFNKKKGLAIETLLGKDAKLVGNVTFAGGLRLDGRMVGNITAEPDKPSMLVVSENAVIEGEVRVAHLILNGTVQGPVYATELLEMQPHAKIIGAVHYASLEIHQGAVVGGVLTHVTHDEVKLLPNLKLAAQNDGRNSGDNLAVSG
jgi:cytoskeletal protein CcmA (bactofilin family)